MPRGIASNPDTDGRRQSSASNGSSGGRPRLPNPNTRTYSLKVSAELHARLTALGSEQVRRILETSA